MVEDEQQFCLKWNNYSLNMTTVFKEMLESEQLCDVTLLAQDKTIKAHRLILTACSSFFRKAFQDMQPWQQPVVFLKDMKYSDLKGIIEFIYNGEVSIDQGALTSFLVAAESLKIKGLTEENQRAHNGTEDYTKIKNNKDTNIRMNTAADMKTSSSSGAGNGGEFPELKPDTVLPPPAANNFNDNIAEEEMEEEEVITEEELKNSINGQPSLDKLYETEEHFLNNSGGVSFDGNVTVPPGISPAEMGLKKTCPHCFQQLSWHALSRHIRDMHKAKTDLVNCKYCMKPFRNKNSLGCHIWRFHKRGRDAKEQPTLQPATATIS